MKNYFCHKCGQPLIQKPIGKHGLQFNTQTGEANTIGVCPTGLCEHSGCEHDWLDSRNIFGNIKEMTCRICNVKGNVANMYGNAD